MSSWVLAMHIKKGAVPLPDHHIWQWAGEESWASVKINAQIFFLRCWWRPKRESTADLLLSSGQKHNCGWLQNMNLCLLNVLSRPLPIGLNNFIQHLSWNMSGLCVRQHVLEFFCHPAWLWGVKIACMLLLTQPVRLGQRPSWKVKVFIPFLNAHTRRWSGMHAAVERGAGSGTNFRRGGGVVNSDPMCVSGYMCYVWPFFLGFSCIIMRSTLWDILCKLCLTSYSHLLTM